MNYCQYCGNKQKIKEDSSWICTNCHRHHYLNPIVTVDAMLFDEDGKILVGVRRNEPARGKLNLPGGFIEVSETLEQAIERELKEELNLDQGDYSALKYNSSRIDTHFFEGRTRQLLCIVMTGKISHRDLESNNEVTEYRWVNPAELKANDLASAGEYTHIQQIVSSHS